jgi:hypothetical protein
MPMQNSKYTAGQSAPYGFGNMSLPNGKAAMGTGTLGFNSPIPAQQNAVASALMAPPQAAAPAMDPRAAQQQRLAGLATGHGGGLGSGMFAPRMRTM